MVSLWSRFNRLFSQLTFLNNSFLPKQRISSYEICKLNLITYIILENSSWLQKNVLLILYARAFSDQHQSAPSVLIFSHQWRGRPLVASGRSWPATGRICCCCRCRLLCVVVGEWWSAAWLLDSSGRRSGRDAKRRSGASSDSWLNPIRVALSQLLLLLLLLLKLFESKRTDSCLIGRPPRRQHHDASWFVRKAPLNHLLYRYNNVQYSFVHYAGCVKFVLAGLWELTLDIRIVQMLQVYNQPVSCNCCRVESRGPVSVSVIFRE